MEERRSENTTLCYIEKENCYLMMHRVKKSHDVNKDKWVGVGGHFEAGESPEECLIREVKEETGLTLDSYRLRGVAFSHGFAFGFSHGRSSSPKRSAFCFAPFGIKKLLHIQGSLSLPPIIAF